MKLVLGQSEKSVQQASGNQGREDHNADRKNEIQDGYTFEFVLRQGK